MVFDDVTLVALIIGLTEIVKKQKYIPEKFIPIFPMVVGIISGILFTDGKIGVQVYTGIAYGLASMGLFSGIKKVKKVKKVNTEE